MTQNRVPCTLGVEKCSGRTLVDRIFCVARHSETPARTLAQNVGYDYERFTKRTSDSLPRAEAPTWLMLALAKHTGRTEHIEALASEAGLVCYRKPTGNSSTERKAADVLREVGEFLTALADRAGDGDDVSHEDVDVLMREWRDVVNVGSALVDSLKERVREERPRPQIVGGAR
jgi:hypothetical protein